MSFAFRTALAALLLFAAQNVYTLDTNTDSVPMQGRQLSERFANAARADKYTGNFVPTRAVDHAAKQFRERVLPQRSVHNEFSSAGMTVHEKGQAQKHSVTTRFGAEKGAEYSVSVFKQASAQNGTCPGEVINYTIQLTNDSNADAGSAAAFMSDFLDFDANLVSGPFSTSGTAEYDALDHEVFWNGTLAPNGGIVTITFDVVIKNVPDGTLISNNPFFEFDFSGGPLFKGSLDSDVVLEVICGGGGTIRALGTKSAFSPFGGCPGDPIFYTITLTNYSDPIVGQLPGFINDLLDFDVNLDFLSATDVDGFDIGDVNYDPFAHKISWDGDLDVGETVFIDAIVVVKDVPDWTPIVNDPFYELGPLQFLLPIAIVIPTICTDFIIDEGVTGSYGDSVYNGQGINVEILFKDGISGVALVYWYSYDSFGLPFFAFGVGTYFGNIMFVEMLFDHAIYNGVVGPFFGPGWNINDFDAFDFTPILLLWKDCDKLGFFFNDLPGLLALDFPWYLMNMDRITQVAGIPCPFQDDLGPAADKQPGPVQSPIAQQVVRPPLKPLFDALPDSSLDRVGGRERVYEKLGLSIGAVKPAPEPEPEPVAAEAEKGIFQIPVGMTGSFFDPAFNGQGINLEILSLPSADKGGGLVLMYWYTFDVSGFPMFVFGVGSFTGNTMVFDMLVDWDGNGPFFGPLWNVNQFLPVAFATASIVWSDCHNGVMNFTMHPTFAGFGFVAHLMNLQRITEISKLPCEDLFK